jgi:hypothetical protein
MGGIHIRTVVLRSTTNLGRILRTVTGKDRQGQARTDRQYVWHKSGPPTGYYEYLLLVLYYCSTNPYPVAGTRQLGKLLVREILLAHPIAHFTVLRSWQHNQQIAAPTGPSRCLPQCHPVPLPWGSGPSAVWAGSLPGGPPSDLESYTPPLAGGRGWRASSLGSGHHSTRDPDRCCAVSLLAAGLATCTRLRFHR